MLGVAHEVEGAREAGTRARYVLESVDGLKLLPLAADVDVDGLGAETGVVCGAVDKSLVLLEKVGWEEDGAAEGREKGVQVRGGRGREG